MPRSRFVILGLLVAGLFIAAAGVALARGGPAEPTSLSLEQQLGKSIFFDEHLSLKQNQSCASCHGPSVGFTGPVSAINAAGAVYPGSNAPLAGNLKPPSAAYAAMSPILHLDKTGTWIGGNFWDGRATGEKLGSPTADQAQGPFLNPVEQGLPDSACVVERVMAAAYPVAFQDVWGALAITWPADIEATCSATTGVVALSPPDRAKSDQAYDQIALSIAAYEASSEVNPFSSKDDQSFGGTARLSQLERRGFALFVGKAGCQACHPATGKQALFTDFSYDNLGIPINPVNPAYLADPVGYGTQDPGVLGLGYTLKDPSLYGMQKVPSLRNVALGVGDSFVKAYGHNGYFKSMAEIVHFYNTRDVLPRCSTNVSAAVAMADNCWPAPEYSATVNHDELGNLGLSADDEAAIVAYLKTLSDGYGQ